MHLIQERIAVRMSMRMRKSGFQMTLPLGRTTYRKRKLLQEKRGNAFNSHFYAHAYFLCSCSRFPRFLLLSRFYPLFLREQRITALEKIKTVAVDTALCTVCVCYYRTSFFLRFLILVFLSCDTHCLLTHLWAIILFRSRNSGQLIVAYRCFICSRALKRI